MLLAREVLGVPEPTGREWYAVQRLHDLEWETVASVTGRNRFRWARSEMQRRAKRTGARHRVVQLVVVTETGEVD